MALVFIAGAILHLRMNIQVFGVPLPLVTGLIYAAVMAPVTIACFLFLPSLTAMVEHMAISRLLVSLFVFAFPTQGDVLLASPPLLAALVVIGGLSISRMLGTAQSGQPKRLRG